MLDVDIFNNKTPGDILRSSLCLVQKSQLQFFPPGHGCGHPLLSDQQRGNDSAEEVLRGPLHRQQERAVHGPHSIHST